MGAINNKVKDLYPLTSIQEGMLFHNIMAQDTGAYFVQYIIGCNKTLELEYVQQALALVMQRYDVLRTAFLYKNTKVPVQVVLKERKPEFTSIDLSQMTNPAAALKNICSQDITRGFDLEKDPLLRVIAVKVDEATYKLVWSIHHIILDGWSNGIILNSFFAYYNQLASGMLKELIEENIKRDIATETSFGQYVKWLKKKDISAAKAYFKGFLKDYENVAIFQQNQGDTCNTAKHSMIRYKTTNTLLQQLKAATKSHEFTLNTIAETAVGILIAQYCNLDDVVFGKVVSGREVPFQDIDHMVGIFINTIPQRIQINSDMTVLELLQKVQSQSNESSRYDYLGLSEINRLSDVGSDLIKILFVYENYYINEAEKSKESTAYEFEVEQDREQTNYDITLSAYEENGEDFYLEVSYETSRYDESYAMNLMKHLEYLLLSITAHLNEKVMNLPRILPDEKALIMHQFNETFSEYDQTETVVSLFEKQVHQVPEQIAVVCDQHTLTYAALNQKANQIAHGLRACGIGRNDLVAVLTDKSCEMMVMLLGIIKAGAAYIPLDISYPAERIQYILADSRAKALLTDTQNVPPVTATQVLNFETLLETHQDSTNPAPINTANDLLYVIYTSGTTGNPKGVMLMHKGILNLNHYFKKAMHVSAADHILQFAKYTFDGSVWEMTMALLNGAKLVVCTEEERLDTDQFMQLVQREKVTIAALPPAFYNNIVGFKPRILITAGSEAIRECVEKCIQDGVHYINSYGPTECTVAATQWECKDLEKIPAKIPIGKPICNTQIYIMSHNQLCGMDIPGEICIHTPGIAKGYLNNETLTQKCFMPNPFGEGVLYRTGDLGCWLKDGNIHYMGRIDKQVKIRGFRIELSEIEMILRSMEEVKDCAVIVREDSTKEKYLCAFITSDYEGINTESLKAALAQHLPAYMLPSYIVQIPSLPVTSNGKLDVKALPEIDLSKQQKYVAPTTTTEVQVAAAFGEILDLPQIGITENFFEIGGHSLRATRLVNTIEAKTGVRIPVKVIFDKKTVQEIAKYIEELQGLAEKETVIPTAQKAAAYPIAAVQKGLYLINELEGDSVLYNMPECFEIQGEIDELQLAQAYQKLVNRHESLRTTFKEKDGELMQYIADQLAVQMITLHIREKDVSTAYEDFITSFDLHQAPLMRLQLVRTEQTNYLFLDMHHIISDGMSLAIAITDLIKLYNGETLTPLRIQYKDYSEWFSQKDLSSQKAYWVNQFKDNLPVLNMPLDFKRPKKQSFKGASLTQGLGGELSMAIETLAKTTQTTEYMVFLSGLMVTLSQYCRQEDIAIGTAISGRTNADLEPIIGMFVNTLVIRGHVDQTLTYQAFLNQIKDTALNAYENQEYPFEELVKEVCLERDLSRNPLFDVIFAFQNNETFKGQMQGATIKSHTDVKSKIAKFDLTFNIDKTASEYELYLEYCSDLFKEETIIRLYEHFKTVMWAIVRNPNCLIKDIESISPEEILAIENFNATHVNMSSDYGLIERFEAQVRQHSSKTAVVFENESLSYEDLNQKANNIAYKLRQLGVTAETPVAVFAKKSAQMLVGILGIVKAGGAYVPIDASYPEERIQYLLEDSGAKVVLTYQTQLPYEDLVTIDLEAALQGNAIYLNPEIINQPEDLLYIIYTSGTTGKPKGVMVEHKSVARLVINPGYVALNHESIILQTGQMSFDASTFEVWGALLNGGTLHLIEQDKLIDYHELGDYIKSQQINTLFLTTTLFNQMFDTSPHMFDGVKYLLTGGEKISETHVQAFKALNHSTQLINCYGPTENTTFTTTYLITEVTENIPIGKPIHCTQLYVMANGKQCGIDIPGELCIGGEGVARGYLGREALTNEKFIPNPFGKGKLYRSGDLVRWRSDGNIEFLGRIDKQVKIRGFRIEPGEIEGVLRKIDYIQDCAVIVREDKQHEKALYAYICAAEKVDLAALKRELQVTLPHYMIPAYIMQIDAIPMTSNGKLNERALPEITCAITTEYIPPANDTEKTLCEIFSQILDVTKVSAIDDFFSIGGHSLRATKVINKIETVMGLRLPLKTIFEFKTPRGLAAFIQKQTTRTAEIMPKATLKPYYPMSSTQKRTYLIEQMDESHVAYNMPECYEIHGEIDVTRLKSCLVQMIKRHEILRTRLFVNEGQMCQQVLEEVPIDFTYEENNASIEAIAQSFIRPFQLELGQVIRMKVVKNDTNYLLFMDMHHIASDGMSFGIFMEEFSKLYNGQSLPELTLQYKDYSEWMQQRDLSHQKAYWLNVFKEEAPIIELPYDYRRPQKQDFTGRVLEKELSPQLVTRLKATCQTLGLTEYILMLAGFMVTLSKYSHQEDIVVGSIISGRIQPKTESMLGMFVNTLAMRGYPTGTKTVQTFLEEMKTTCMKAYSNQEYPFDALVEEVVTQRDRSRNPLFDVMFSVQNNEEVPLQLGTAQITPMAIGQKIAKFDLSIDVYTSEKRYMLSAEYCTKLFKAATIESILDHYLLILEQMCTQLNTPISRLKLTTLAEEEAIHQVFNHTAKPYPKDQTLNDLFEMQVKKHPEHIAVIYDDQKLTYNELNEKANQVAHHLRKLGVQPDDFVAIIAERSLEMIIGIYGIIKSGAAYVPIDPKYPEERIHYMLTDCQPKALVTYIQETTQSEYMSAIKVIAQLENTTLPMIDLRPHQPIWLEDTQNPAIINQPRHLAYVIYTSGTTGKPKGVMIEHRSLINLIVAYEALYAMRQDDVLLQFASFSFDQSVWEIFGLILLGGTLCVMKDKMYEDKETFFKYLTKHQVTVAGFTPAFIAEYTPEDFKNLRLLESGGAELKADIIRKWLGKATVMNTYGPTENTVNATTYVCNEGVDHLRIPIGKPAANVQVYILSGQTLCGIGMLGELCIAGDGLARGYLNRPELTAQKFIDNPFGPGKLYRTGDLAKWLPDGNIDYMGRIDEQVKIRGFRIELGEIESVMRSLPQVHDCAVIAQKDLSGDLAMYAYLVSEQVLNIEEIRTTLKGRLPFYMIPAYITQIEKIPVTTNGKVDKRALSAIEIMDTKTYVAPTTDIEAALCKAYENVLNLNQVSTTDTFFELGGDSIKAIRIVSKLREYGYETKVRELLKNVPITELATHITPIKVNVFAQGEVTGKIENTPIMYAFDAMHLTKPNHYNQSMMLETTKANTSAIRKAAAAVVSHHDMLRGVKIAGGMFIRPINEGTLYDYDEYDLSHQTIQQQEAYIQMQSSLLQGTIDLYKGPLMKVVVYKGNEKDYIQFIIHHLVVDGVSFRIIIEDFIHAYMAILKDLPVQLPQKTQSYLEWAKQVRLFTQSEAILAHKAYWDKVCQHLQEGRIIYQKQAATQYSSCQVNWSSELTAKLMKEFIPQHNVTINDVLLTALSRAVKQLTGQNKVAIELEGHGRENINETMGIDRTVGWFTSVYPVLLTAAEDIWESLEATKAMLHQIPAQGATYQMIKYLMPADYEDTVDLSFNYLGSFSEGSEEEAMIQLSDMPVGTTVAKENIFARPIDINGLMSHDALAFEIQYDLGKYSEAFMMEFARLYEAALIEILHTPSPIDEGSSKTVICPSQKSLPVVLQDEVRVYLHRSLPLCILLAYDQYKAWYYSNYIQIFSVKPEAGITELNYLEPRDSYVDISEVICLGYHMFKLEDDFIAFVKEKLNLGYYIIANVDEIALSNKYFYQQEHYVHASLIYGYDDQTKCLKGIGFDESEIFTYLDFKYEEMQQAFINGKKYYSIGAPWCEWSAIQLVKPKTPHKNFSFDVRKCLRDLHGYIYGVADPYRLYTFEYADEAIAYGIETYDVLLERLKARKETGEFTIDYRAIHLMYEHKQGLYRRMQYLIATYHLGSDFVAETKKLLELIEDLNKVRKQWFPIDYERDTLIPEDLPVLDAMIEQIACLKHNEKAILTRLYEMLVKAFEKMQ